MMSREEVHIRQHRDRLLALAESSAAAQAHKPNNQKRRSVNKSPIRFGVGGKTTAGPKLSIQDFVRADPGYTPNIEHLVFPDRRKTSPVKAPSTDGSKTRSRLAEMFALSKHLQQRSADRDTKGRDSQGSTQRKQTVNRSVDSNMEFFRVGVSHSSVPSAVTSSRPEPRRWATVDEPVHAANKPVPTRISPSMDADRDRERSAEKLQPRGSNISVLHLRSTSEPWETSPTSVYPPSISSGSGSSRSYTAVVHSTSVSGPSMGSSITSGPVLIKHRSLGASTTSYQSQSQVSAQSRTKKDDSFISSSQVSSEDLFSCSRELSPVRWCDREVDGVYLGKSGWVQVQQRSLDENRRNNYGTSVDENRRNNYGSSLGTTTTTNSVTSSLPQSRRPNMKLADYHSASEPGIKRSEKSRPVYLPLLKRDIEYASASPSSPPLNIPESFSPPPITPIISPPPAFQDRITKIPKSRPVYGKPPFLPRSNAIVDSDIISPPSSPPPLSAKLSPPQINWNSLPEPRTTPTNCLPRRPKLTPSPIKTMPLSRELGSPYNRISQAKSLEEAGTNRRSQFLQRYKESSSSSSSSLGFRSLDSCVSRPAMPRLSEHTDSLDMYEDADEEDNNSSSLNLSNVSSVLLNSSPDSVLDRMGSREKTSPSNRTRFVHPRSQRRSPASQEASKQLTCSSPSSSSSSGAEVVAGASAFPARSPSGSVTPFRRSAPSRQYTVNRSSINIQDEHRVRRSRSLQLPEKRSPGSITAYREHAVVPSATKLSPQQAGPDPHRFVIKVNNTTERQRRQHPLSQPQSLNDELDEDMLREAEVVTEFLYGTRSRAAAKALILQRYHDREREAQMMKESTMQPSNNNGFNVYFVDERNKQRQKTLQRGATTPNITSSNQTYQTSPTTEIKNSCTSTTCNFWPHCGQRESIYPPASSMKASQSYPSHQRPPEPINNRAVTPELNKKRPQSQNANGQSSRLSPDGRVVRREKPERRLSPMSRSPSGGAANSSCSSSSSDVWLTTSDRTITRSPKDASTPLDDAPSFPQTLPPSSTTITIPKEREMILTRPGSAPADVEKKLMVSTKNTELANSQQRSMSLPKSFLSGNGAGTSRHGGQFPCKRQGQESGHHGLSPSPRHRPPTPEVAHTAPVTPSHEPVLERKRSPGLTKAVRRTKASSTPHLLEQPEWDTSRKWKTKTSGSVDTSIQKEMGSATILSSHPRLQPSDSSNQSHKNISESVLQKFRKTFSLRFQKKGSKESFSSDYGDGFIDPSEEDSPLHMPTPSSESLIVSKDIDTTEQQKYRFGPLVWRSSKERKKNSKATRSLKCNSGDSGIQIEMVSGFSGGGGTGGDSSESHDTDQLDTDSPQPVRRRRNTAIDKGSRPHSDHLINHILIEKFKADLQSPRDHRVQHLRRTHSDLGGQRLLQYHRMMMSPLKGRPRRQPPDIPGGVTLRSPRRPGCSQLRRSLSQPVDIDKLSPLMRTKTSGLRLAGTTNVLSEDEHDGRLGTSDDEIMSDSESSMASLSERKKSLEINMDEEMVILAEAVFDHVAIEAEELAFRAGDVIEVLETVNRDWWWGSTDGRRGWFPAAFVRLRVSQEDTVEDCLAAMASGKSSSKQHRRRTSISLLSNEQVRTSVVRELVHTERDFVKVLTDVVEGYLTECRRRTDMFTPEQIQTIFINLEDMLKFQSGFLRDLEACVNWDAPHKSCVGNCFLTHRAGFRMYSDYCNHHPMATATLQELYQFNNYSKFFEACRLMRGLIEIPLDGYLLTPVQRICKYPLQLAELLKYTKPDHEDYEQIKEALEAMRDVAVLINERKRRMESLEKLFAWQQRVEAWEGGDLIDVSSQLIFQGEVIRVTSGMWTNNITLFLFDHQIIYCKKDILKRNTFVYKGRICLDTSEIIDIPDGRDPQLGVSVRHGVKVYSCVRDKFLLFCCRSSNEKQRWLDAFAQERKLVAQDRDEGLEFQQNARNLAKIAARCQRRPPSKPRNGPNYKRDSAYMGSMLQINSHSSNSLGRKMGTWFMFGSNKKSRHYDQTS